MAIPKICGIEQEYAITVGSGVAFDPIQASYLVVNSFDRVAQAIWDYDQETPFLDARGFSFDETMIHISSADNFRINNLLVNGARYYVDHAHPEFSTAECLSVLDLIAFDRAGEYILDIARQNAAAKMEGNQTIHIYKNNSDHKGNSYGCHENYLVSTELYQRLFPDTSTKSREVYAQLIPFFVTRQIFTGAGKAGSENGTERTDYQISQRSDFFEITIGANTTANRPIINTRDEPHADKQFFRRLHVIVGDSNMCEVANLLKIGTTRLVLAMMEDKCLNLDFALQDPVSDIKKVSRDLTMTKPVVLENGTRITPLAIQERFLEAADSYCNNTENDTKENRLILDYWKKVLATLKEDPMLLDGTLDWVTKYTLLERHVRKKQLNWNHPRIKRMDIKYHDVDRGSGLYYLLESRNRVKRILDGDERIKHFVQNPPTDTRAYFRSQCLKKYGDEVVQANWDVLHFQSGSTRKKIPLPDPTKGTKDRVDQILKESDTIEQLLNNLTN